MQLGADRQHLFFLLKPRLVGLNFEYIVLGHCCVQLLWMRQTLWDFGYNLNKVPLLCDNESAIRLADNPIEHNRTKHIDIQHHFLRDHQQRKDIDIFHVSTDH
jgi:hypothetical protein